MAPRKKTAAAKKKQAAARKESRWVECREV